MSSYDGPGTKNDTTYTYDAGLNRIKKDVDGTVTKFVYDGANILNYGYNYNNIMISNLGTVLKDKGR